MPDAIGALVNLCDPHISHALFLAPFADIAMATEHLLAQHAALQAVVGKERLGHRRQQRHQTHGLLPFARVLGIAGQVQLLAYVGGEGPSAFGQGAHGQQHAPYVAVMNDRVGDLVLGLRASGGPTLQAVLA